MGNFIKRKLVMRRFEREAIKCLKSLPDMNVQDFEAEINSLIKETNIRLGALMCEAVFKPNPIIPYPDNEASDANKIVFYGLLSRDERCMLANGEVTDLSNECILDVDMINEMRKAEIAKVEEFYKKAYELLGTTKSIQLTGNLFFNYSLASGCYYALKDIFGNISEIREIDEEYERKQDIDNKFYINRGKPFVAVDYQHMDEIDRIKNELDELWEILRPNGQENDEVVEPTHEIKMINLK